MVLFEFRVDHIYHRLVVSVFFWGQSVVNVVNVVGGCGVWKCAF